MKLPGKRLIYAIWLGCALAGGVAAYIQLRDQGQAALTARMLTAIGYMPADASLRLSDLADLNVIDERDQGRTGLGAERFDEIALRIDGTRLEANHLSDLLREMARGLGDFQQTASNADAAFCVPMPEGFLAESAVVDRGTRALWDRLNVAPPASAPLDAAPCLDEPHLSALAQWLEQFNHLALSFKTLVRTAFHTGDAGDWRRAVELQAEFVVVNHALSHMTELVARADIKREAQRLAHDHAQEARIYQGRVTKSIFGIALPSVLIASFAPLLRDGVVHQMLRRRRAARWRLKRAGQDNVNAPSTSLRSQ